MLIKKNLKLSGISSFIYNLSIVRQYVTYIAILDNESAIPVFFF